MGNLARNTILRPIHGFDTAHLLQELKHYLPSQTPLRDFIHHNSLHAFQHQKFFDGIFTASRIFGYQVSLELDDYRKMLANGRIRESIIDRVISRKHSDESLAIWKERMIHKQYDTGQVPRIGAIRSLWKSQYKIDLDGLVHPILFRTLSSYLDQGISIASFPSHSDGFLASIRALQKNSLVGFFKSKRAIKLLEDTSVDIPYLLRLLLGKEEHFEHYLFDQQFAHKGWSGMVAVLEDKPTALLDQRKISLHDLIVFELLLEIDALDEWFGPYWSPLTTTLDLDPIDLFAPVPESELNEVISLWQSAFEWSYYDEVLTGIRSSSAREPITETAVSFQAIFCIDERECSLRRHIESVDPNSQTFGTPGFFGVEFFYQPHNGKFIDKLCPAPVTPGFLVKEAPSVGAHRKDILFTNKPQQFIIGTLFSLMAGYWALIEMMRNLFFPRMAPAISNAFTHMNKQAPLEIESTGIQDENFALSGFQVTDMTNRVEKVLRGIGLIENFAPLVYIVAHGSSSANNPHHGAHDCGACSGRPGSVNARVFAYMANHSQVREELRSRGILIPETTLFIGSMHDTASDEIEYYDEPEKNSPFASLHFQHARHIESALDLNAKERSRRFASINTKAALKKVRSEIKNRSVSYFEPRPELGHGTNSLCIIGRRSVSQHLFLDRRAFLNSYDYRTDRDGKILTDLMKPIGPVCGGINLEYYFSRVDNQKLGAGTKLPHNVMGLIGVANGSDGDLRPGLPVQMIEVHDPVRLLIIVEQKPDVVLQCIQSSPETYEWYINEWVHLIALDPETNSFYYFSKGAFAPYTTQFDGLPLLSEPSIYFESAALMKSPAIADATKENLPVHLLNIEI